MVTHSNNRVVIAGAALVLFMTAIGGTVQESLNGQINTSVYCQFYPTYAACKGTTLRPAAPTPVVPLMGGMPGTPTVTPTPAPTPAPSTSGPYGGQYVPTPVAVPTPAPTAAPVQAVTTCSTKGQMGGTLVASYKPTQTPPEPRTLLNHGSSDTTYAYNLWSSTALDAKILMLCVYSYPGNMNNGVLPLVLPSTGATPAAVLGMVCPAFDSVGSMLVAAYPNTTDAAGNLQPLPAIRKMLSDNSDTPLTPVYAFFNGRRVCVHAPNVKYTTMSGPISVNDSRP